MIQTRKSFLNFSLISPTVKSFGKPALKLVGGWKRMRGNAERMKPRSVMPVKTPKTPQPRRPMKSRRDQSVPSCAFSRSRFARSRTCSARRRSSSAFSSASVTCFSAFAIPMRLRCLAAGNFEGGLPSPHHRDHESTHDHHDRARKQHHAHRWKQEDQHPTREQERNAHRKWIERRLLALDPLNDDGFGSVDRLLQQADREFFELGTDRRSLRHVRVVDRLSNRARQVLDSILQDPRSVLHLNREIYYRPCYFSTAPEAVRRTITRRSPRRTS